MGLELTTRSRVACSTEPDRGPPKSGYSWCKRKGEGGSGCGDSPQEIYLPGFESKNRSGRGEKITSVLIQAETSLKTLMNSAILVWEVTRTQSKYCKVVKDTEGE